MTEDEARIHLSGRSSLRLDSFRASLPTTRTSYLIAWLMGPQELGKTLGVDATKVDDEEVMLDLMAAALAVGDELDRRIPALKGV